jgi:hypothetical protein
MVYAEEDELSQSQIREETPRFGDVSCQIMQEIAGFIYR